MCTQATTIGPKGNEPEDANLSVMDHSPCHRVWDNLAKAVSQQPMALWYPLKASRNLDGAHWPGLGTDLCCNWLALRIPQPLNSHADDNVVCRKCSTNVYWPTGQACWWFYSHFSPSPKLLFEALDAGPLAKPAKKAISLPWGNILTLSCYSTFLPTAQQRMSDHCTQQAVFISS